MLLASLVGMLTLQTGAWPENPSTDFSGIPQVSGTVSIVSHNVQVELYPRYATVTSTTLVKNNGGVGAASIKIPRERIGDQQSGFPTFEIKATWVNQPLTLKPTSGSKVDGPHSLYTNWLTGTGAMKAGGSYALRISYLVPLGRSGFDHKQNFAAYDLSTSSPIGTLMCSYKYANGVVFRLPETRPDIGWQVGSRGVFKRWENYTGDAGISNLAYYPGGFKDIGGGR